MSGVVRLRAALNAHFKRMGANLWPDAVYLPRYLYVELMNDPNGLHETATGVCTHGMQAEISPDDDIIFGYKEKP